MILKSSRVFEVIEKFKMSCTFGDHSYRSICLCLDSEYVQNEYPQNKITPQMIPFALIVSILCYLMQMNAKIRMNELKILKAILRY